MVDPTDALTASLRAEAAFTDADEKLGMAFAEQAAVIVANAQAYWGARDHSMHLDEAMRSLAVIEQAKGIVMARSSIVERTERAATPAQP